MSLFTKFTRNSLEFSGNFAFDIKYFLEHMEYQLARLHYFHLFLINLRDISKKKYNRKWHTKKKKEIR